MEEIEDEIEREKRELAALRQAQRLKERTIQELILKKERLKAKQDEDEEGSCNFYEEVAEAAPAAAAPPPAQYEDDKRRVGEGYYYVDEDFSSSYQEATLAPPPPQEQQLQFKTHEDGYITFTTRVRSPPQSDFSFNLFKCI
jgi:hypothetical protein